MAFATLPVALNKVRPILMASIHRAAVFSGLSLGEFLVLLCLPSEAMLLFVLTM